MSPETTTSGQTWHEFAERVLAGALAAGDRLVLGHGGDGGDEVGLVAGHEDHARALGHQRHGGIEHVHLGVAVQLERVALFHAGLHAAGSVEDQQVQ
jgi:hypothetical protein